MMTTMRPSEAKEKRRAGLEKHLEKMSPFEKLRRGFTVGRPAVVKHTAVSAVAAAQNELDRLTKKRDELKISAVLEVGLVVFTPEVGGKIVEVTMDPRKAAEAIGVIAAIPEPIIAGLVYAIADHKDYEMWTRAFLKGRTIEKMLDSAVAYLAHELRKKQGHVVSGDYSA